MTLAVFLARHRTLGRVLRRVPGFTNALSRRVWTDFLAQPGNRADLDQGRADFEAGRTYLFDTESGWMTPNPNWPNDGPQPKPAYRLER